MQPSLQPDDNTPTPGEIKGTKTDEIPTSSQDEYSQYLKSVQTSVSSNSDRPDQARKSSEPKSPTELKILLAYLWFTFGLCALSIVWIVYISSINPSAGAGAGWGLLIVVPGAVLSAVYLGVIYLVMWLKNRSSARKMISHSEEQVPNIHLDRRPQSGPILLRMAVIYGCLTVFCAIAIAVGIIAFSQGWLDPATVFGEPWAGITLTIVGILYGMAGLVGAVLSFMSTEMTPARRNKAALLFLMPMWVGILGQSILSTAAPFLMEGSKVTRTTNEIRRLTFKPLMPPVEFVGSYATKFKNLLVYEGEFSIDFGKVTSTSSETTMRLSQIDMRDKGKLAGRYISCESATRQFTSGQGTIIMTADEPTASRRWYCFERDGVHVTLVVDSSDLLRNDDGIQVKDEQAVAAFVDSLKPISPEQITSYYEK